MADSKFWFLLLLVPTHSFENICDRLEEIDRNLLELPAKYVSLGLPWGMHRHTKVFKSAELTKSWEVVEQYRVRGLNETFQQVSDFLEDKNCLWFAWGGAVRDLILGKKPSDIDAAITCNPHRLKRICNAHYGEDKCVRPNPNSQKLTIGGDEPERFSDDTVDPVDLCHWNATFKVYASHWEFSLNTLSLWVDKRDPVEKKIYLIDVTGFGVEDACRHQFRIPAKREHWWEWSHEDRSVLKLLRFWKLRLRGFSPLNEEEINFVVKETMERFDPERFGFFFCHKILNGIRHNSTCRIFSFDQKIVENFVELIAKDFGEKYYNETLKPILEDVLYGSNVPKEQIELLNL